MASIHHVRGKRYFICDYTGAPCQIRFYIPTGPKLNQKLGCFSSLPILLRWLFEKEGGFTFNFQKTKDTLCAFYNQPDIPMAPPLPIERVPLNEIELGEYMFELDMGTAWVMVPKGEELPELL